MSKDTTERELRICDQAHKCNYGEDNAGRSCLYGRPRLERKSARPIAGHCITVGAIIRTVLFNADQKNEDPNVSFKMHKMEKTLE